MFAVPQDGAGGQLQDYPSGTHRISTMKRRILITGILIVLICLMAYLLLSPGKPSMQVLHDKIEVGWTLHQVEELLGQGRIIAGSYYLGQ